MANLEKKYENLRRTTMMLGLILLLVIILSAVAFYKGWLGAPGRIYFSPSENQIYVRCAENPSICGELGKCEEVMIKTEREEISDKICMKL